MLQKPKAVHINNNNNKQSNSEKLNVQNIIPEQSDGTHLLHNTHRNFPDTKEKNLDTVTQSRSLDPTAR